MKILLIEDQPNILQSLDLRLKDEGFSVDSENDGARGSYLARTNNYDLMIIDYMLPSKSGADICREVRARNIETPIIIISVEGKTYDKVKLLDIGADDYVSKPFAFEELLARIRALLRRPKNIIAEVLSIDDLVLDSRKFKVERSGKEIVLTKKEFALLEYLLRNQGCVVSRGSIMENVWDIHGDLFSNTIETHILTLRKKIHLKNSKSLIHTVSGRGYKIDVV